jgi:hypothetical protein
MKLKPLLLLAVLMTGAAGPATGEEGLKSGPRAGTSVPGPFTALAVTNVGMPGSAGTMTDFFEQYGQNPVVLIFARGVNDPLTRLVKRLDAEVALFKAARLRAVVVMLSDDEGLETRLKGLAKKQAIRNVSLAIMNPAGPPKYNLAKMADVTILLYKRHKVVANHAFKKGDLTGAAVDAVIADVPKVTGK